METIPDFKWDVYNIKDKNEEIVDALCRNLKESLKHYNKNADKMSVYVFLDKNYNEIK